MLRNVKAIFKNGFKESKVLRKEYLLVIESNTKKLRVGYTQAD